MQNIILILDIFFQSIAALLAFRLIWITGRRVEWILIFIVLSVMDIRRIQNFYNYQESEIATLNLDIVLSVSISFLMMIAWFKIPKFFLEYREARNKIEASESELIKIKQFLQNIFNSVPASIAVLDKEGTIIYVNEIWNKFGRENGMPDNYSSVGESYYNVCRSDSISEDEKGTLIVNLIKRTLDGENLTDAIKYECSSLTEIRFFSVTVSGFYQEEKRYAVVIHTNITEKETIQKKMEESYILLRSAFSTMKDAIVISDMNGDNVQFNEEFINFPRFRKEESLIRKLEEKMKAWDVYLEDKLITVDMLAGPRALRGENGRNVEYKFIRKENGEGWIGSFNFSPVKDSNENIIGFIVIGRDITEQKKREEDLRISEERWRLLVKSISDYIIVLDIDGKIQFVNHHLKGFTKENTYGKKYEDFIPEEQKQIHRDAFERAIQTGTIQSFERKGLGDIGIFRYYSATLIPIIERDGKKNVISLMRDITERKEKELGLLQYRHDLEKLVKERTFQLENSNIKILKYNAELLQKEMALKAINKELEAFSYSVSHDLRTPLRSIDGFSNLILKKYGSILPDEGKDFFKRIINAAQKMAILIDELLKLSRISRLEVKREAFNVSQLVNNLIQELIREAPDRKTKFTIEPNLFMEADKKLIQIALQNLLSNAWKYTQKKPITEIEFGSFHEGEEKIYFIKDNGAGFDMQYSNKLFGAFQRLHSNQEFEGIGVGLAICMRVISKLGGRIWGEGEVDKGATFYFTVSENNKIENVL